MTQYYCIKCKRPYAEHEVPEDGLCRTFPCTGGLRSNIIRKDVEAKEAGLCILLMDASGSMKEPAYGTDHNHLSKYGASSVTKREAVTDSAAQAIFDLERIGKKENAYIKIIKFDLVQEEVLHMTVEAIIKKYEKWETLASFLHSELAKMGGETDINSALKLAFKHIERFKSGKMEEIGSYIPLTHSQWDDNKKDVIKIHNARVLIYTDGEQTPRFNPLSSPFKAMETDLLLTAFIGEAGQIGHTELQNITGYCPVHKNQQFFLIDNPDQYKTLKGLFKMASRTSGFCKTCLTS